jgi:nucleoside-diphosphate-sugar epimerase
MRILVTGGAGYIGSVLTPALLARGWIVTVVDTFAAGRPFLAQCCADPKFAPVRGDARDMRIMGELLAKHDVIIPLAALVGAPLCAGDETGAVSLNRDAVVALTQRLSPDQRVVFPNSNSGYGIGMSNAYCTEESPLRPVSLYGRTKVEAEDAVLHTGVV